MTSENLTTLTEQIISTLTIQTFFGKIFPKFSLIPKLSQGAYFRVIRALAEQGTLAKECNYLSNKCNAGSSYREQPYLLQFVLPQSFYSLAEIEYL